MCDTHFYVVYLTPALQALVLLGILFGISTTKKKLVSNNRLTFPSTGLFTGSVYNLQFPPVCQLTQLLTKGESLHLNPHKLWYFIMNQILGLGTYFGNRAVQLWLPQYTMHHSYMYNVVYTRQWTVLSVHCTLNNTVQCTLYTANFTLYSVHCTQNSTVQCKMYTVH